MSNMNRQPGGTPTGGQFAGTDHAEAEGVDLTSGSLPHWVAEWGEDLDTKFGDKLGEWGYGIDAYGTGKGTTTALEVLDFDDEEQAAEFYGPERAAWLASLEISGSAEHHMDEYNRVSDTEVDGSCTVKAPDGTVVATAEWRSLDNHSETDGSLSAGYDADVVASGAGYPPSWGRPVDAESRTEPVLEQGK